VSVFSLSCLTYLGTALAGSTLGLLWPTMRLSLHEPVGALGIVLAAGVAASAVSSVATGRVLPRVAPGPLLAAGAAAVAVALALEAAAPAMWVIVAGAALFSLGFGSIDAVLNVYAAGHFSARDINWMHASYGLGATLGPLLITALLSGGAGWRGCMGALAGAVAVVAAVLAVTRNRWARPPGETAASPGPPPAPPAPGEPALSRRRALAAGMTFTAVECGVESAAGIWGYIFLTSGYGVSAVAAGVIVSAYWAMMFAGRGLLGLLAARLGPARVLAVAVAGVPAGALLMTVPGPVPVAVAGMMLLGLATAPVFPLFTLATGNRVGAGTASAAIGLQVAASTVGSAVLPGGIGLLIGSLSARALGPSLLVLGLAVAGVYRLTLVPREPGKLKSSRVQP